MGVISSLLADDREEHPTLYALRKLSLIEETYSASEK